MTTRRLAAILAADVVGFSKLIGEDEEGTLTTLREIRKEIVNPVLVEHGGRVFKLMGDGMLAEFPSAVQALRAAVGIQERLRQRNAEASAGRRVEVRIGVHQGDVVVEGTDLLGDGVNIAARLEALAEPGGICISSRVQEDASGKITLNVRDMGEQSLKNIARPVRAYRVSLVSIPSKETKGGRPALPLPDKPSIAVLPFQNMSADAEQDYFCDGMVEDIITGLSHLPWLMVIARNSCFTYKGRAVDVKQVGRELGVRYVLEGSVRKSAGHLRINGQLIDATTGAHVWADRFDGAVEDVFALQDQVTQSVVGAIEPSLQRAEIERVIRKPTENLDAYDCFLRGMALAQGLSLERWREAQRFFLRATELDSDYGAAYALAAYFYNYALVQGWLTDLKVEIAEGVRLAHCAVETGTNDPVALANAGLTLAFLGNEFEAGVALIDRALAINPSYAFGWYNSGTIRAFLGHSDVAIEHLKRAMRLDPRTPLFFVYPNMIAGAHLFAGRYDEAVAAANESLGLQATYVPALRTKASALGWLGRTTEARQVIGQILAVYPAMRLSNLPERLPFLSPELRARMIDGLRKAGLPE